jgi:microcystin-dependent protein
MADPFVAEIRIFPFNFAPKGWAWCNGQLLPLGQNTALFSLLGTTYGGDGKATFALPDLRGRAPMHPGQGPGLSLRIQGESGGSDSVILEEDELPAHTHRVLAAEEDAVFKTPAGMFVASGNAMFATAPNRTLSSQALATAGGGLPHNNLQPYLTLFFCIALQGVFPARPPAPAG